MFDVQRFRLRLFVVSVCFCQRRPLSAFCIPNFSFPQVADVLAPFDPVFRFVW
jgi:hypothetical protein